MVDLYKTMTEISPVKQIILAGQVVVLLPPANLTRAAPMADFFYLLLSFF